jgi:hypothetical protein
MNENLQTSIEYWCSFNIYSIYIFEYNKLNFENTE